MLWKGNIPRFRHDNLKALRRGLFINLLILMKSKTFYFPVLSVLLLLGFNVFILQGNPSQISNSIGFSKVIGYEMRPGMEPTSGFNTQIFARKEQFDQNFVSKPVKGKASKLDFSRFILMVCTSAKSNIETTLSLQKLIKKDGVFEVYFTAKYGKALKVPAAASCLYSTAIDKSLNGIVFYINGKMVQDVRN